MINFYQNSKGLKAIILCLTAVLMLITASANAIEKSTANVKSEIGGDFTLTDHNNESFALEQLRGKLVMMFFGYTFCPDICPSELATMAKILKKLGKDSDKISSLFITVDPKRDTPEKLKNYVPFFSPHLVGLTGSEEEIAAVTKAYKVQSKLHAKKENSEYYLVDHSANLYVLNEEGKLIHLIPFGFPAEHILKVLKDEISRLGSADKTNLVTN